jgi:hypothetical protein
MPFEIFHFRESDRVLQEKNLDRDFEATMQYLDDVLYGTLYRRELLREALQDMGWRDNGNLNFLEGRRYLPLTGCLYDLGEPRFMEDAEMSKIFPDPTQPQMEKKWAS